MKVPRRRLNAEVSVKVRVEVVKLRLAQLLEASQLSNQPTGDRPGLPVALSLSQLCSICQTVGFLEGMALADRLVADQTLEEVDLVADLIDRLRDLPGPPVPLNASRPADFRPQHETDRRQRPMRVEADRRIADRRQIAGRRASDRTEIA